jgi:Fe-Mn family superoxide dismutase
MSIVKVKPFELPPLPYVETALEPVISGRTMSFHYEKHHKGYVDTLNKLVPDTDYADMSLEEVIQQSHKKKSDEKAQKIFNNAAQIWNHTFFWSSMKPKGGTPDGKIAKLVEQEFQSYDGFVTKFTEAATGQFGSGWVWLVSKGGKLAIEKKPNAETPIAEGGHPLLVVDVWEHAYYLDYQNRRKDFVEAVIKNLLNWDFANENLEAG